MATTSILRRPNGLFWTFIGTGLLALLLAASWRVATGANLEARGKEWSLKVNEATSSLEEARQQLEQQASKQKADMAERDTYWQQQLVAARQACPATPAPSITPPPPANPGASAATQQALADAARKTAESRAIARDISEMSRMRFLRSF